MQAGGEGLGGKRRGQGRQAVSRKQHLCEDDARIPSQTGFTRNREGEENGPTECLVHHGTRQPGLCRGREKNRKGSVFLEARSKETKVPRPRAAPGQGGFRL